MQAYQVSMAMPLFFPLAQLHPWHLLGSSSPGSPAPAVLSQELQWPQQLLLLSFWVWKSFCLIYEQKCFNSFSSGAEKSICS